MSAGDRPICPACGMIDWGGHWCKGNPNPWFNTYPVIPQPIEDHGYIENIQGMQRELERANKYGNEMRKDRDSYLLTINNLYIEIGAQKDIIDKREAERDGLKEALRMLRVTINDWRAERDDARKWAQRMRWDRDYYRGWIVSMQRSVFRLNRENARLVRELAEARENRKEF